MKKLALDRILIGIRPQIFLCVSTRDTSSHSKIPASL
jgi:hypothetical protein